MNLKQFPSFLSSCSTELYPLSFYEKAEYLMEIVLFRLALSNKIIQHAFVLFFVFLFQVMATALTVARDNIAILFFSMRKK